MLCASNYNGACGEDSGGPLIIKNPSYGGRYVLAGIVSGGIGCGLVNGLDVYTDVLAHIDWIKRYCKL